MCYNYYWVAKENNQWLNCLHAINRVPKGKKTQTRITIRLHANILKKISENGKKMHTTTLKKGHFRTLKCDDLGMFVH